MQKHLVSQASTQPNQAFCGNICEATTLRLVSYSGCCLRLIEVYYMMINLVLGSVAKYMIYIDVWYIEF